MTELAKIFHHVQRQLFPMLKEELGLLSELGRQFYEVISLTDLGRFTRSYEWCGNGAPPHARVWLMHAFIAKNPSLRRTHGGRTGQQPLEVTLWWPLGAGTRRGQGDVSSDVRGPRTHRHHTVCAVVLKPMSTSALDGLSRVPSAPALPRRPA